MDFTVIVRQELVKTGVSGVHGMEFDHIEVFDLPTDPAIADRPNFVLCPDMAYNRSPCGTGLMVLPPYLESSDWREMKARMAAVFDATDLPCVISRQQPRPPAVPGTRRSRACGSHRHH